MIAWLLVVQVFTGQAPVVNQIGPFKTEAACAAAGKAVSKAMVGVRFVCVPDGLPA